MRYFAVEFIKHPDMTLEHNAVMTPQEAFDYLMQHREGDSILLLVSHEMPHGEAEAMTLEERGLAND